MRLASRRASSNDAPPRGWRSHNLALVLASALVAVGATHSVFAQGGARPLADRLGVAHVGGKYHLTDKDFLNEGGQQIQALGARVIKVWFMRNPQESYPFNSQWPPVGSLIELAKTPYFREF